MPNLIALREQRGQKVDTLRGIHSKAESEKRDLTDAEQSAFDAGKAEVDKLDRDIRNADFLADAERRMEAEPISGTGGMAELEARFQPGKALAEFVSSGRLTGAEGEWAAEHRSGRPGAFAVPTSVIMGETRALTTTAPAGGPGGALVPTNQGPLIDRVRPRLATEALGATVLSNLTGNLDLPKLKASGQAYWVSEHTNVTRSDPQFAKVSMGPKTVGAEYEISRRMLLQATALETILRNDLSYLLRQALDAAAVKGGGANEPVGILSTAGIKLVAGGTNGRALDMNMTADLIGAIEDDTETGRGFLIGPKARTAAMKLVDSVGQPFGLSAVFQNEPVALSRALPVNGTKGSGTNLSAIIYGVWSELIIGYWSAVDMVPNPYHSDVASKGGLLIHAFLDADVAVRHPENFAVTTDVVAG